MNLDAGEITATAGTEWQIEVCDEVGSTSDVVRERALTGAPHGLVVFAEHQTQGRGRRQNRWLAPRGKDLMFSLLLRPSAPQACWPRITTLAALAVCKGIENELPLKPALKWPNDVLIAGKKIAGLLAESLVTPEGPCVVLGLGINVNSLGFPAEISATATSLLQQLERGPPELNRNLIATAVLAAFSRELERLEANFDGAMDEVRARSWLLGKTIRCVVNGAELFGRAADLNHEGHLIVMLPDGSTRALSSADEVRAAS